MSAKDAGDRLDRLDAFAEAGHALTVSLEIPLADDHWRTRGFAGTPA